MKHITNTRVIRPGKKGNMTHKNIIERAITTNHNEIPVRSQAREKPWKSGIASPLRRVLVGAFFLWVAAGGTRADVVTDWNVAMTAYAAQVDAPNGTLLPNVETRVYAMAHIAMLEAIKEAQSHRHHRNASASPEAAAARKLVFDFMCWLLAQQAIHAAAEADLSRKWKYLVVVSGLWTVGQPRGFPCGGLWRKVKPCERWLKTHIPKRSACSSNCCAAPRPPERLP